MPTPAEHLDLSKHDALVVVDVQNDFLRRGTLPVPMGEGVIAPLNVYVQLFHDRHLTIVATRDWHPHDHCSFVEQGGPWPAHCRRGTFGARFPNDLILPNDILVIDKATESSVEDFSGFSSTDMDPKFRDRGIERFFVGGLATEYCVLHTVLDGLHLGYRIVVLEDAIRAINLRPEDGAEACEAMRRAGALFARVEDFNA